MSKFRGIDGLVILGGMVTGSPLINGAVAQSATTASLDGGSTLQGVVRPGDTFTVAGDAQVYTIVAGGVINVSTHVLVGFTFTPAVVPGGGWADNAAITFVSNAVAQGRSFSLEMAREVLDGTCLGDTSRSTDLDLPEWQGAGTVLLDAADTRQLAIINQVKSGATATALALLLRVAASKQFWGDVKCNNMQITGGQKGSLVSMQFNYTGTGALAPNWN